MSDKSRAAGESTMELGEDGAAAETFRRRFWADVNAGRMLELSEYIALWPEHAATIAREFLLRVDDDEEIDEDSGERKIGPYRCRHEIGRGAQGVVYLAEHEELQRPVALKVVPVGDANSAHYLRRFRREAAVAARLDHPGLCGVLESGTADGFAFIAMRYVPGVSLADLIGEARAQGARDLTTFLMLVEDEEMPEPSPVAETSSPSASRGSSGPRERREQLRIVRLVEEIARALHVAHEAEVVHRDLKPANIMVGEDGQPVILDFGLARSEDEDLEDLTLSGDVLGTPAYMAPEQVPGGTGRVDRRSDVHALGVILFECLSCRRPYEGDSLPSLWERIATGRSAELGRINPSVPRALRTIVQRALARDPERRFATALDLAEDLARFRQSRPILSRPTPWWVSLWLWRRRNPVVSALVFLSLIALIAGLWVSLVALFDRDEALDLREESLRRERRERDGREEVLKLYRRLDDVDRVARLLHEFERLWPRQPEMMPRMEAWLEEAEELLQRTPRYEKARADLEARALPVDSAREARLREREASTLLSARAIWRQDIEILKPRPADPWYGKFSKDFPAYIKKVREKLARSEKDPRLATKRRHWSFASDRDLWLHGELVSILEGSERLREAIPEVRGRRAAIDRIATLSLEKEKEAWDRCLADLGSDERFASLSLRAQVGLVPLGKDRSSGLWEFWHVGSGARPAFESEDGVNGSARIALDSGLVLVLIPPHPEFFMGSSRLGRNPDPQRTLDEGPITKLRLDAFLISKYEMTRGQWRRVNREPQPLSAGLLIDRETKNDPRYPVSSLDWNEAGDAAFRYGMELPTEAQWEAACRGGTDTPWPMGRKAGDVVGHANFADLTSWKAYPGDPSTFDRDHDDGFSAYAPVGMLKANPYGLHDILGNVEEWCRDRHQVYAAGTPRDGDGLRRAALHKIRVLRGGSWQSKLVQLRSAARSMAAESMRSDRIGLRPVRAWR